MLAELEGPLDRLDAAWATLERELSALSDAQRDFLPPGGGWSIAQVVDHMQQVETGFLTIIERSDGRGPRRRGPLRWIAYGAVKLVFLIGLRVRIPAGVPGDEPTGVRPAAASERTRAARDSMRRYAVDLGREDLSRSVGKHPVAGPVNFREAFWFLEAHFRHHLRQIARIERRPSYPGGGV